MSHKKKISSLNKFINLTIRKYEIAYNINDDKFTLLMQKTNEDRLR